MTTSAKRPNDDDDLGICAWCDRKAIDLIFTEGSPGGALKKQKKAPVCGDHYRKFRDQGLPSRNDWLLRRPGRFDK